MVRGSTESPNHSSHCAPRDVCGGSVWHANDSRAFSSHGTPDISWRWYVLRFVAMGRSARGMLTVLFVLIISVSTAAGSSTRPEYLDMFL